MKVIMSPHAGCYNHGCEAIVRSTVSMLNLSKDNAILYSSDTENDTQFGMDRICRLVKNESVQRRLSVLLSKYFALKERILAGDRDLEEISYKHKKALMDRKNLIHLSIGGDNYCYPGMQQIVSEHIKLFSYNDIPSILWGCSFEESLITDKVIEELKKYVAITARESLSYQMLLDKGIKDNVILCSDPAFTLPREQVDCFAPLFNKTECIGINISALMGRFNAYPDATYRNIKSLLEYLLKNTDYSIILIPHVRQTGNDDIVPSRQLADTFKNERIHIVEENYNCMQLKYIVSKCKVFIGCRTHSTIAAYSTCVPTLVVGYSTKARGIAKDIFGDFTDLLVDVREFKSDNDLLKKYQSFYEREHELKTHLQNVMPDYTNRAFKAKDALLRVIDDR